VATRPRTPATGAPVTLRVRTPVSSDGPTAPSQPVRPPSAPTIAPPGGDVAHRACTPTTGALTAPCARNPAPSPTGRTAAVPAPHEPTQLDWATDVDSSIGPVPSASDFRPATPPQSVRALPKPAVTPSGNDVAPRARTPARAMPELAVTYPPRDFSGLRSGSKNPWGSIKHRRHRSHPPRDLSSLRSGAPNPWGSLCRRKYYSHTNQSRYAHSNSEPVSTPHSEPVQHSHGTRQHSPLHPQSPRPALPHPTPVHIFQVIQHPHGISPTKPKITKIIPAAPIKFQKNTLQARCACGNIIPARRPDRRSRDRRFWRRSRRFGIANEGVRYVWGGHL
jgi:hypothetical protein